MKLDLSLMDRPAGRLHAELDMPVLEGTDLDKGAFALPAVQDVSGRRFQLVGARLGAIDAAAGRRARGRAPAQSAARAAELCGRPAPRAGPAAAATPPHP
jgi:hypothetical protein